MALITPTVVFSDDHKTITVIGVNKDRVVRHATTFLNFCVRKDGGVTIWTDGSHKDQTVRTDAYGRLMNSKRAPKN
jgi:hypothetical protein